MHERIRDRALHVMDELMHHPITTLFHTPIDPERAPAGYFTRIRNPRDLTDICNLLKTSKFTSLSEWSDDVELVWRNCEDFYGVHSLMGVAAQYSRKLFQKLRQQTEEKNVKQWCTELNRLRARESRLVSQCPGRVHGIASQLKDFQPFQQSEPIQCFSDKDIQNFMEASKMITAEPNLRHMITIIKEIQPRLDVDERTSGALWLDVTLLNGRTFLALQEYMRSVLEEQGLKYPE
jgi:hypothetical protein